MPRKGGSIGRVARQNEKYIEHATSSDRVGICEDCGKPFEQVWRPSKGADGTGEYTHFKTCGSCRMAKASGYKKVTIPYSPHTAQQIILNSPARFKLMCCGNRFGKDLHAIGEGVLKFIEMENENRSIDVNPPVLWWIVSPSMTYARQNWRDLKKLFPKELVYNISISNLTIETINGGIIEVHSADDPESLVGVGLDIVTITEAARVREFEIVWANLRQRLDSPGRGPNGQGGIALINSTPKGRTGFSTLLKMGEKGSANYSPEYETFRFTTWDNPFMAAKRYKIVGKNALGEDITFEDSIRMSMSEARYRQDYLAEELAELNSVFPNYEKVMVKPPPECKTDEQKEEFWKEWEKPDPFETYTCGYDPGKTIDGAPLWIRDSKGKVVKIIEMQRLSWDAQWDKIAFYSRLYNGAVCNFGKTGLGETIASQLEKRGVKCNPINEQGRNKEKLVESLAVVVEQQYCKIPWSQKVDSQFKDYISITRDTGSTKYSNATDGEHDDHVSAAYFCFADFIITEITAPYVGYLGEIQKTY